MSRRVIETEFTTKEWRTTEAALRAYGKEGQAALDGIRTKAKGADAGLKALNAAGKDLESGMHAMAGRAGVFGSALSALGTKGLIAAAGLGAVTIAVSKGLRAYAEEERAQLRLQAVLRTTGNAAGVTATQIDDLAEKLERTTFFKKEDILQAAGALATFKSVSGDAFESTIKLAADMSETLGNDLVTNARLLGRAMKDPADGFDALKRAIGETAPEIAAAAQALAENGDKAGAVNLIIKELNGRYGGAAQQAANGYAGSIDNLYDSFDDLLKSIGKLVAESGWPKFLSDTADQINRITAGINKLKSFKHSDVLKDLRAESQQKLRLAEGFGNGKKIYEARAEIDYYDERIRDAERRENATDYGTEFGPPAPGRRSGGSAGTRGAGTKQATRELQEYIASLEEENRLVRMNTRDRAIEERLLRAENAARRDGRKLTADQRAEVTRQAAALYDYNAALEEQAEQTKRAAEAQKELWRPVEHALERVQDQFADMLVEGRFSARSLVDIFKRAGAEIASAMVFRPIIGNLMSGITGGLVPGVSGSVTGAGGGLGGGGLLSLSGLSNIGSGLLSGFNTPLLNPGIAFDIGSALGLSGGTVGTLHTALGNFTPMSGLASLGGSLLANALGLGGKYSSATGTIGGALGTAFGGPIGGAVGSFLGTAVGGLFGGGTPHPAASFGSRLDPSGALNVNALLSKHMGSEGASSTAAQLSQFLSTIAQAGGFQYKPNTVIGNFDPAGGVLRADYLLPIGFNPNDPSSTADAFRQLTIGLAEMAGVVDNDVLDALRNVSVAGRDAGGVLEAVVGRLNFIAGIKAFNDALLDDPATSNLSPEEIRSRASEAFYASADNATRGTATLEQVQANALAFLGASQSYAGKASTLYANDLDQLRKRLTDLGGNPPRYASGGDFKAGTFIVHPGETVMTSSTPGTVKNANETRKMLAGSAQTAAVMSQMKEIAVAQLRALESLNSLMARNMAR